MATAIGFAEHPLIRALLEEAHRFSFFQAVSLIERATEAVAVGGGGPAAKEAIRFRPEVTLGFPASSLSQVEWITRSGGDEVRHVDEDRLFRVTANFLGLYGTQSPLPNYWSEEILHEQADDTTVRDFLDIFHHRVYSFFYRAWSKYRLHVQHRPDATDLFTQRLLALIGFANREVRERTSLPYVRLLRYAGILLIHSRPAAGLEALVSDWLGGLPVRVEPCNLRWVAIAPPCRSRLGVGPSTLGEDVTLGDRVYDRAGGYRIVVGPVDYATYLRFLPDGSEHGTVRALADLYTGGVLEPELEVRLAGEDVPTAKLLRPEGPPRLGWSAWLFAETPDDASVVFPLREAA